MGMKTFAAVNLVMLLSAAPLALAQSTTSESTHKPAASSTSASGSTMSKSPTRAAHVDAKPVHELEAAAQRLRDAVHELAQAPAGPKRNEAIRQANRTLLEVQNAIAALPPEIVVAAGKEGDYKQAMANLESAAQRLRDSAHTLAREPVGEERATAIKDVNKALIDTQQAMIDIPMTSATASAAAR
jgi:cell fate (sporulation/competence/biofilm development) regulator YmcA (YheA/YmcA/DUF963 family)